MMKKYGNYLMLAGMAALAMALFYLAAAAWGSLIWSRERIQLYLEEPIGRNEAVRLVEQRLQALEEEGLDDAKQEEISDFCIWGQQEAVLENKSLSRSAKVWAIVFCGNSKLLFEDCQAPVRGDDQGCLVDQGAAWELFGSTKVEGKEITYEDKTYIIRKVLPGREHMAVFPAAAQSDPKKNDGTAQEAAAKDQESQMFQRVTLVKPESQSVNDLLISWSHRYGIDPKYLDLELLRGIAGVCVLLFPATASLFFLYVLCRECYQEKRWQWKAAFALTAVFFAVAAWLFFKGWVQIPDSYIPAKWSDFSFWGSLAEEKREAVKLLLGISTSVLDYGWISPFFVSAGCGLVGGLVAIVVILIYLRTMNPTKFPVS